MQDDSAKMKSSQDARQGRAGLNVRWVLVCGVLLVVVAFIGVWLFRA